MSEMDKQQQDDRGGQTALALCTEGAGGSAVNSSPASESESEFLERKAKLIRGAYADAKMSAEEAVENILEVGRLLLEAKELVDYGTFGAWIDRHLPFDRRQAQYYMDAARRYKRLPDTKRAAFLQCRSLRALRSSLDQELPSDRTRPSGKSSRRNPARRATAEDGEYHIEGIESRRLLELIGRFLTRFCDDLLLACDREGCSEERRLEYVQHLDATCDIITVTCRTLTHELDDLIPKGAKIAGTNLERLIRGGPEAVVTR